MTQYTGAADRDKTLALLWREQFGEPQGTRGPKQKITVDHVVDATIVMADDNGIEGISMRKIAERVGISAMSLYTYVDSKSALIDLMIDRVVGQIPRSAPDGDWRARLSSIARSLLAHYLAHPWVLQVDTSRPPLGPGISDQYEYQLAAIDGIGLTDLQMDAVVALVGNFVASSARSAIGAGRSASQSGQTDVEWWEANTPMLETVMTASRFPVSRRVGVAAGEEYQSVASPDFGFEFGLAMILDGVAGLIPPQP